MNSVNNLTLKQKIFVSISFLYILFNAVPLFTAYLPITVQLVSILTVVVCGLIYPRSLISRPMIWLYVFLFVLILYAITGKYFHINGLSNTTMPASSRIIIEAAWIMPSVLIAAILTEREDNHKLFKTIGWGSLILLIISFIYILPLISISANLLRESALIDSPNIPKGLPDYTLMHSYPMMLPGLCLAFRKSDFRRSIMFAAAILLFCYVVIKTAISTSIGVSFAFIIFALVASKHSFDKTLILLAICCILFIIAYYNNVILSFVEWLIPYFENTAVSEKLIDIRDSINLGQITGGTLEGRGNLHELSKQSFFSNPFFGGDAVGRHSQILDLLGSVGLLGFIPFIMIYISIIKLYLPEVHNRFNRLFLYSCFGIALIYLYSKGIFGSTGWLFTYVLAPSFVIAVANTKLNKSINHHCEHY